MKLIRLLQSKGSAAVLGAGVFLGITALLLIREISHGRRAAAAGALAVARVTGPRPSWEFHNPEVELLIEELKAQKAAGATREKQLNEFADRLEVERSELTLLLQSVRQMQSDFDRNIVRVREEETANLKKLARTYAVMEPAAAAAIMKEVEESALVKILVFMKEAETAPILETLARQGEAEARRVARVLERLRLSLSRNPAEKPKP